MARLRRVALWCSAVVVGTLGIALLVVNLYVQSQGTQARIQQELSRRLQTPIRIRSISVTPWGGLTLSGITIPQVSSATTIDFLEAKSFHLHVRLLPLFSRRLIIKEVSLLSPNVVWAQTADGKWRLPGSQPKESLPSSISPPELAIPTPAPGTDQSAAPNVEKMSPPPAGPVEVPQPKIPNSVFVPELRRLNVTNGIFRFLDQSGSSVATFENVRFHSSVRDGRTLRGSVDVTKISLRDRFFLQDLQSLLHYEPEELNLAKISARSGSGEVIGDFSLEPQSQDSPFTVSVKFRGVQADQMVVEAGGPKGVIQGRLEGSLEAKGKSADATALTGHGEISLRGGQLQQYSLLVALGQILQIEELTQLQLQLAEAKYHIDPGVVTVDQLVLRSPNIRVSATGTIGFNGKLRLQSQLAINDKVRSQLFTPIRDNFRPIDEPGFSAVDFQVNGTIDRPKTNLMEKVVGRNLKDFVSGLLGGGGKSDKPKRKRAQQEPADSGSPTPVAPAGNSNASPSP